jgi:predicted site-specific integrase-resolvase
MSTQNDDLLTAGEVTGKFGVARGTVSRWGLTGRLLSARTPGGMRRYYVVEVAALLRGESRERARELALAERDRLFGPPA